MRHLDNADQERSLPLDRRAFLNTGTALAAASVAARAEPGLPSQQYRVIDTHLHLFNTRLQGANGVPKYIGTDATVETALVAMDRGGVARAFLISNAAEDIAVQIRQRGFDPATVKGVLGGNFLRVCRAVFEE